MLQILTEITEGRGRQGTLNSLRHGRTIVDSALCALGARSNPV